MERAIRHNSVLCTDPIFILGILPRSGTNFLYDLLCLHPDCDASAPIPEDYLVSRANLLIDYINSVSWNWRIDWEVEDQKDILFHYIGKGLTAFLNSQAINNDNSKVKRRIVTKTPSVRNLDYFFKLFPSSHLIILVRDGRAVVESSVKSFNNNYETMMRLWAEAAETILRFDQATKNSDFKYLIVRYEDLWNNLEAELRKILTFLELDGEAYDFDVAVNLPIKGSSELRRRGKSQLNWQPVEKTSDFNPLQRWSHWGHTLHRRFDWIAGQYLTEFGYETKYYSNNRMLWSVWHNILDIKWQVRDMSRRQIFDRLPGRIKRLVVERILKKDIIASGYAKIK